MATLSAATLAAIYWIVKIFFAVLAGIVSLLVVAVPALNHHEKANRSTTLSRHYATTRFGRTVRKRKSLTFAKDSEESVEHYAAIVDDLQTGDLFLFSGDRWWSWIIRIATWSRMSHAGMIYRTGSCVYVAEVVERFRFIPEGRWFRVDKGGFQLRLLSDYVTSHPGQCYVAKVAPEFEKTFSRFKVHQAIDASRAWSYGWCGIGFQILMKCPFVCIATYLWTWKSIDQSWGPSYSPFCSWATNIWATIAGHDPVPHLAQQLTTPADIERSMLWPELLAVAA